MSDESDRQNVIDSLSAKVRNVYRSKVLRVSPETSKAYARTGGGASSIEHIQEEPLAELRARTDGKNVALSFTIPVDRHTSFVLGLESAAKDEVVADKLVKNFDYPHNNFLASVGRGESGALTMFVSVDGLELETRKEGEVVVTKLEKDNWYEITDEMQSNSRMVMSGKNGSRLSVRIHDNKPHNLTEREKFVLNNEPRIRRVFNESWFHKTHTPSSYVESHYDPEFDGEVLNFLKSNVKGSKEWVPFCGDGEKYWGIAARNPTENCIEINDVEVCAVVSDDDGVEHKFMPLDMPRTYLANSKVVYKGKEGQNTGLQTGLIHLGDNPRDGWYYTTQPIPKLKDGKVEGYFVLIGREANLIPDKQDALYDAFWKNSDGSSD